MPLDSESRLIAKIQRRGDGEAANTLIEKYYKEIYAYTYRQTADQPLAMDLTQEIFIGMLKSIGGFDREKSGFRTWLYRIATYKIVDYYRSRQYRQAKLSMEIDIELVSDDNLTEQLERKESTHRVLEAVGRLDAQPQQIFRLKIFGSRTFAQIAEMLSIPESTVKSSYYASVRSIKKDMEENSFGN